MGRLSKLEKMKEPQHTEQAQEWLNKISTVYESCKKKYYKMCVEMNINVDEDVFSNTVLSCYDSIARNGLQDLTQQGCENYLFRSFRTNMYQVSNYDKRKVSVNISTVEFPINDEDVIKKQSFQDFKVIYILNTIEENFDNISFNLWRLKYMTEKMSYEKLRNITGIKDCKKRIIDINNWLKENISLKEIEKEFEEYLENI